MPASAVWTASLEDDVSRVAAKMEKQLGLLDGQASVLFKSTKGNLKDFSAGLKYSGVAASDAALIVAKYGDAMKSARKETLGLADDAKTLKSAIAQISIGALRSVGEKLTALPGMALGGLTTLGDKIFDVGKSLTESVIAAAQFRANALSGLEYMLGSREQAVDIFKQAQQLASDTPLDTDRVITGIKQLVTSGFSGDESMLLFKSVADQASKFADDAGMQDKVISAFSRVKGRGVATGEDLESFRVAGFRAEDIIKALREKDNLAPLFKDITSKDADEDVIKKVKKVLGEGKIGSTTFLNAVIASQEKGGEDKNIGEFAKKQGKVSLTGTISNFKSAFGDLLKSVDLQNWPGVQSFQKFLTRVTEALQGDVGKGLLKTIENIMNSLLGGLDKISSSDIAGFVGTIQTVGNQAVDVIKNAWDWLDKLLHAEPGNFVETIKDVLIDLGSYIGQGLYAGFKSAAFGESVEDYGRKVKGRLASGDKAVDREDAAAAATIEAANKQIEATNALAGFISGDAGPSMSVAKPSAFLDFPDVPKLADGGIVSSPTLAIVGEAGPEAVVPLSTMAGFGADAISSLSSLGRSGDVGGVMALGRGGVVISGGINVQVTGGGDGAAMGQVIAVSIERELTSLLERRAAEG